ncbi:MAG: NADH-quinone oxidoreductase subunit N [Chloroflexi bacterium]|nr:NADH-quinone oxidoreductase subunit N [Chloroflexota bacterium]
MLLQLTDRLPQNVSLLTPELSLAGLAVAVILLDLVTKRKSLLTAVAVLGLIAPLVFSIDLLNRTGETGFAGALLVDEFSIFFKFLFIAVAALVILGSQDYVAKFKHFQGEYYALILLATGGMMLMASTGELISIYIALELNSLSLAALATFLRDGKSAEAGVKFLVLGAISSAVLLYGMAMVYGLTGSTQLHEIARFIPEGRLFDNPALLLGVVMIAAGFGFKIASVPFQMWVPDVYEGAPTPVTAFLSVASKAAGFAVILRVFYSGFGLVDVDWRLLFAVLAALSMFLGNLVAIVQNNIKRMLGYSTIAHAGYILMGVAAITVTGDKGELLGPSAVLFYLAAYAITNLGAFFGVIIISGKVNSDQIDDFAGMAKRSPVLAFALALCLVSLIGIPPTAVFWAKLYIFNAAVQSDLVWLVIVGVINSVISAYFYLRVIKVMYLRPPASEEKVPFSLPVGAAMGITSLAVLFFGIAPAWLLRAATEAVRNTFPPFS